MLTAFYVCFRLLMILGVPALVAGIVIYIAYIGYMQSNKPKYLSQHDNIGATISQCSSCNAAVHYGDYYCTKCGSRLA